MKVTFYSKIGCKLCDWYWDVCKAKSEYLNIPITKVVFHSDKEALEFMKPLGLMKVPFIILNGTDIYPYNTIYKVFLNI